MNIPKDAICVFKDGNQWCAVFGDFINLQESLAGFGDTFSLAVDSLLDVVKQEVNKLP